MTFTALPQQAGGLFLNDGGMETSLIYLDGVALPQFASFVLLKTSAGREQLRRYYQPYLEVAAATPGARFVLETPTWRASTYWGRLLGYDERALAAANREGVQLVRELREEWRPRLSGALVLAGIIGPRGDGYITDAPESADAAAAYHRPQAAALQAGGVDLLTAVTMTSSTEALGVTRAAAGVGLPVAVSFTVETDGRLPSSEGLRAAIERVDSEAGAAPAYYAVNCAHPSHFEAVFVDAGPWTSRIRGLRANFSPRSHAELDAATELDIGDPPDLADRYCRLRTSLPGLNVLGGVCGTEARHLRAIRDAWTSEARAPG